MLTWRRSAPQTQDPTGPVASPAGTPRPAGDDGAVVFRASGLGLSYGSAPALADVDLDIRANEITALIGPSGCGKTTFLRCLNRMNDLIPGARLVGDVTFHGQSLYAPDVDAADVRRRVGMVFPTPNPFPRSIRENLMFGRRINGLEESDEPVEDALRRARLWDEVKDMLDQDAFALSAGQQQRLCIARAIAAEPDAILMDEPCSVLDPHSTAAIEDLMRDLVRRYTIVIATHDLQQAARLSHRTAFLALAGSGPGGERHGVLVEQGETERLFSAPADQRTRDYITGRDG